MKTLHANRSIAIEDTRRNTVKYAAIAIQNILSGLFIGHTTRCFTLLFLNAWNMLDILKIEENKGS